MEEICFFCGVTATSREHCPPLSIFPEAKDIDSGMSYRNNLITVPACIDHNLRKSKDDEYLMMILVANFSNNKISKNQMKTKVFRAWQRRPYIAETVVASPNITHLDGEEKLTFKVDLNRFNHSMESIARGLIFYETGCIIRGQFLVRSPNMISSNSANYETVLDVNEDIVAVMKAVFINMNFEGNNPEVFKYQMYMPEEIGHIGCIRLIFYEGFEVIVFVKCEL